MKKYFYFVLFVCNLLFAKNNQEFRATWVITKDHINGSQSAETNKARLRRIMDQHQSANMNAVLWQVRQGGTAYYRSSFEPWGYYANYQDPGYDPLASAIEEAHKRGMEVHAWFNAFNTSSMVEGAPAFEHPEWVCRDAQQQPMTSSRSLSPGMEAVRAYTLKVAMEIVRNYDIDGLHLDYVRWNEYSSSEAAQTLQKTEIAPREMDGLITKEQIENLQVNTASRYLYDIEHSFNAGVPAGFGSWEEWWRWSVTEFVRALHDSIQAYKPWVRLSAAVLGNYNWGGWQGYGTVYQDAALWFNEGYVDQLMPMHYHWFDYQGFYNMLGGPHGDNSSNDCWGKYIQDGIADGRLYSCGPSATDLDPNKPKWMDPKPVVQAGRNVPWVDGFQFFSYADWANYDYWQTAKQTLFPQKNKIRPAKFMHDSIPPSPTISIIKIDSLQYQIRVALDSNTSKDGRFVIYRSTNPITDVNGDEIIDIHFGDAPFIFIDQFDGLQNYTDKYYYYATYCDRYWNESTPSKIDSSQAVPSLPPTVLVTSPANGDTIAVNISGKITFSKSMDTISVRNAFSVTPNIYVKQYKWSADKKILTIELAQKLLYASCYTVTVSESARDINGKPLDGNGDGISGDAYQYTFYTQERDVTGPHIIAAHPIDGYSERFLIEDVINITFDEWLEPASVIDSLIRLTKGQSLIPFAKLLATSGDKSVLSIQPKQPLDINSNYELKLSGAVQDTSSNPMGNDFSIAFTTASQRNSQVKYIDQFFSISSWKQPSYSGSTVGISVQGTSLIFSKSVYLPNVHALQRSSAALFYEWDENAIEFLLREYLDISSAPAKVLFDSSYTLQCYVYGDGSSNKMRLCFDDGNQHEVTQWIPIDWTGWRLVEWKLGDPNSLGLWGGLGDGTINSSSLNIDSIQLTHESEAALSGVIYFDNLSVVKKTSFPVTVEEEEKSQPTQFTLYQNYPNPFNPTTTIAFDLPETGDANLAVYDLLGRQVVVLVNGKKSAGRHSVELDGTSLSSGVYFYRLCFHNRQLSRRFLLIK